MNTMLFNVGDKIRVITNLTFMAARKGATGTITGVEEGFINIRWDRNGLDEGQMDGGYYPEGKFEVVKKPHRRSSIARDLLLSRGARTLLLHLERHGSISPAEAQVIYGMPKIARQIWELRQDAVYIKTELRKDPKGQRYARYSLAA